MWTDAAFSIGDHRVTLSVERVAPERRAAIAVSVAWLAAASASPGDANAAVWRVLVEDVIGPHIAFTIDHESPESLDHTFWNEAMRRATSTFIRVNGLESDIRRSLSSMQADQQTDQQRTIQ